MAHLQKRHRIASEELRQLLQAQEALDDQFEQLRQQRLEQHSQVEDQRDVVEGLRVAVEQAELEVPPKRSPSQLDVRYGLVNQEICGPCLRELASML